MNNNYDFDEDDEDGFFQIDPNDFDPDSVIGEDENLAGLDAFLMHLQEELNKSNIQIINPVRFKEFRYAYRVIAETVKAISPDADVKYGMCELGFGSAYIRIETDELEVSDIKKFVSALKMANNFEIHPLLNGNIQINFGFHNVMIRQNLEE